MADIKRNVLDILGHPNFCYAWCINENGKFEFEGKDKEIIATQAMELISKRQGILKDIKNYLASGSNTFANTYKVNVNGEDVYMNIYGAKNKYGVICGIATEVTAQKLNELKVQKLAYSDTLTGLPNRQSIKDFLSKEISKSLRGLTKGAVFFMDLDKFKSINDELGHAYGDLLLKEVSVRLAKCLRSYDLVGRVSGDEFIVIQVDVKSRQDIITVAKKILSIFEESWKLTDKECRLHASLGISMYPQDGKTAEEVMRNADKAMYLSKKKSGNTFTFYNKDEDKSLEQKMKDSEDLLQSIDKNELVLHYQPQIDIRNSRICCIEALVRWERPGYGLVRPLEFLSLAEENGFMPKVGRFVADKALKDLLKIMGETSYDGTIALNISESQLNDESFIPFVLKKATEYGIDRRSLEIELAESIIVNMDKRYIADLAKKLGNGITVSLDNFSDSYTAIRNTKKYDVSTIKLDKNYIIGLDDNKDKVENMINIGHRYGFSVVAEGVETDDQLNQLIAYNCDKYQGYYFSRPLPINELIAYMNKCNTYQNESYIKWISRA